MPNRHNTLFYLDIFLLSYFMMFSAEEGVYSNPAFTRSEPDAGRGQKDH